ncbi:RHS repeat-associated core domain-containing protein [Pseudomonas alloputida]|uniref:RHS repeat-associated core domain-containing protein n=1 Tax=Pseudomonas TaxID=286 RepID=UPI003EEC76F2
MSAASSKALMRHLFYAGNRELVAQLGGARTRLLLGANRLLAQMHDRAALLQTANQNTVIGMLEHGRTRGEAYTPYGFSPVCNLPVIVAFNGCWRDTLTGLYSLGQGNRWYSSGIQRLLSADGLSPFGAGSINAYAYCESDPVNFQDRSGRARTGLTKVLNRHKVPMEFKNIIKKTIEADPSLEYGFIGSKQRRTSGAGLPVGSFDSREYKLIFPVKDDVHPTSDKFIFRGEKGVEYALQKSTAHGVRYEYVRDKLSVKVNPKVSTDHYRDAKFTWQGGATSVSITSVAATVRQPDQPPSYEEATKNSH